MLGQIDPMRSLADRLSALGLDDRAIWSKTGELDYALVWRFAEGHARLDWRITVDADGAGRTMLTVKLAARGSDPAARARTLAAWTLLEELAQAHTRRLARTLDDYANADDYSVAVLEAPPASRRRPPDKPVARLRAVV